MSDLCCCMAEANTTLQKLEKKKKKSRKGEHKYCSPFRSKISHWRGGLTYQAVRAEFQVQRKDRGILLNLIKSQSLRTSSTRKNGNEGDNLIDYLKCLTK